jgi:ATP-dependent Clp protease adaptor protein ClpS
VSSIPERPPIRREEQPRTDTTTVEEKEVRAIPRYHVVLLDDDDHTYDYVIEMLMDIFGHTREAAYQMAFTVDADGRVVVDTTHKERAELKRDQILSYGADWRIPRCKGSMGAIIEPAD